MFSVCTIHFWLWFFFFFYNQHIFIGKWKKQKITEKKWKGNIFEGRGDQNSGVGYPASPSLHKDQWLDSCPWTPLEEVQSPFRRFQQHSKTKNWGYSHRKRRKTTHLLCIIPSPKPALFSPRMQLPLNQERKSRVGSQLSSRLETLHEGPTSVSPHRLVK